VSVVNVVNNVGKQTNLDYRSNRIYVHSRNNIMYTTDLTEQEPLNTSSLCFFMSKGQVTKPLIGWVGGDEKKPDEAENRLSRTTVQDLAIPQSRAVQHALPPHLSFK
jgi:hypothetical protein